MVLDGLRRLRDPVWKTGRWDACADSPKVSLGDIGVLILVNSSKLAIDTGDMSNVAVDVVPVLCVSSVGDEGRAL